MTALPSTNEERVGGFEIVVALLSLLVLASMVMDSLVQLPSEASRMLQSLDTVVCGIFLIDFVVRFRRATNKAAFMKWGWIDLVASIPNIDVLRWGRAVRVLRVIRILRGVRSFHKVLALVFRDRIKSGLGAVLTTCFLLIVFASFAILMCESGQDANIKTAEDAVWWSVTTITTVGYGDKYPVSTEGRVLAMVLMASGVGLFGALSGLIASFFLGASNDESEKGMEALAVEVRALRTEIRKLSDAATSKSELEKRSFDE